MDGLTDVVVSSISPTFTEMLMTDFNRNIDYISLRPLPVNQLGMDILNQTNFK